MRSPVENSLTKTGKIVNFRCAKLDNDAKLDLLDYATILNMGAHTGAAPRIRKLKLRHPELSNSEIARTVGCSPTNVTDVLKTFLGTQSTTDLQAFQETKADIYDAIQHRVLASVTPEKIAKAGLAESVTAAAILEDKARLVRGQATSINVNVLWQAIDAIRDSDDNKPAASVIEGKP